MKPYSFVRKGCYVFYCTVCSCLLIGQLSGFWNKVHILLAYQELLCFALLHNNIFPTQKQDTDVFSTGATINLYLNKSTDTEYKWTVAYVENK